MASQRYSAKFKDETGSLGIKMAAIFRYQESI